MPACQPFGLQLFFTQELCQTGDQEWVEKWKDIIMIPKDEDVAKKFRSFCGVATASKSVNPTLASPTSAKDRG